MKPKVLFFDIESTPNIGYTWGKYEQNVIAFKKEWELLSFAYKFEGDSVHCKSQNNLSEKQLVSELHSLLERADVVVAHNGDEFDIKKAKAKFLEFGFPPPKPFLSIDTKKEAKRYFKFNSNSLDDLGNLLGVGRKMQTGGFDLWLNCMKGDKKAFAKMEKYNKQDVLLLERVYNKLKPWMKSHPNVAIGKPDACPKCAGVLQSRGYLATGAGILKQRFQCKECKGWCSSVKSEKQKPLVRGA